MVLVNWLCNCWVIHEGSGVFSDLQTVDDDTWRMLPDYGARPVGVDAETTPAKPAKLCAPLSTVSSVPEGPWVKADDNGGVTSCALILP